MNRPNKPRVVMVVASFPKLSETFIVSKAVGLLRAGWDVHIACASSDPAEWSRFGPESGIESLRGRVHVQWPSRPISKMAALFLPGLASSVLRNPFGSLRYLSKSWSTHSFNSFKWLYYDSKIAALKPALIHFEFGALAIDRMHLKRILGCKVVVSFRGYDLNFSGLDKPTYFDPVWRNADAVHVLGEDLWKRAMSRGCPETMPHTAISPAIDLEYFRRCTPAIEGIGAFRLLSVGRLEWKKGYEFALQAVKRVRDRGIEVRYRIVGDGEFRPALHFAIHQLGLQDCVEALGALPRDQVKQELVQCDVFLHAAVSEGFCNAVVEAQAMEVPVVCSDAGGLPENVEDGVTGFVVPRRDPEAMAERLCQLAADPELRQWMGKAGRARAEERYTLTRQIESFDQLYREVLGIQNVL